MILFGLARRAAKQIEKKCPRFYKVSVGVRRTGCDRRGHKRRVDPIQPRAHEQVVPARIGRLLQEQIVRLQLDAAWNSQPL